MSDIKSALQSTDVINLSDEEASAEVLKQAVQSLWEVVNNLTRLRRAKSEHYYVTIFGSARIQPNEQVYVDVKRLAADLTRMGCGIVTGGGPGLMQAANEGASEVDGKDSKHSVGIRIDLPFEQAVNPFVGQMFQHRTFFSRLHQFVLMSEAFIVVPGGIGTVLELMMIWQLLQVRKLYGTPLVLLGPMWKDLVAWTHQHMLVPGSEMVSPLDLEIPQCVNTVEEAIEIVRKDHLEWLASHVGDASSPLAPGGGEGVRG
jgi:uncharacterized protein (TIGR00730 family)